MKSIAIVICQPHSDPSLESILQTHNGNLQELTKRITIHFAQRKQLQPIKDALTHYAAATGYADLHLHFRTLFLFNYSLNKIQNL